MNSHFHSIFRHLCLFSRLLNLVRRSDKKKTLPSWLMIFFCVCVYILFPLCDRKAFLFFDCENWNRKMNIQLMKKEWKSQLLEAMRGKERKLTSQNEHGKCAKKLFARPHERLRSVSFRIEIEIYIKCDKCAQCLIQCCQRFQKLVNSTPTKEKKKYYMLYDVLFLISV